MISDRNGLRVVKASWSHIAQSGVTLVVLTALLGACVEERQYDPPPPSAPHLRLPQNNAYEGSTLNLSLMPTFSWDEVEKDRGEITYELEYSTDSGLANAELVRTAEPRYQPDRPLPVSLRPPLGQRYYWRVRACSPTSCSDYSSIWWLNLGRSNKDFNGDGYDDLLVGTPYNSESGEYAGRAYIFFGGPGSFDTSSDVVLLNEFPNAAGDLFGISVSWIGDFNGDGFSDVSVGASDAGAGRVYLYFGGSGATQNNAVDVIISDATGQSGFGLSSSPAGDVNGDEFDDLIVGNPKDDSRGASTGRAYLYFGGTEGTLDLNDGILSGREMFDGFSKSAEAAGDIDGDGLADFLINNWMDPTHLPPTCATHAYLGQLGTSFQPKQELHFLVNDRAACLATANNAGDVNGDGFSDRWVAVNSPEATSLLLQLGGRAPTSTADLEISMEAGIFELASVGDVNGDQLNDVSVYEYRTNISCSIYLGMQQQGNTTISSSASTTLACSDAWRRAGDLNGDGLQDLVGNEAANQAIRIYFGSMGSSFDPNADATINLGAHNLTNYSIATSRL